jgi:hypothetical protein
MTNSDYDDFNYDDFNYDDFNYDLFDCDDFDYNYERNEDSEDNERKIIVEKIDEYIYVLNHCFCCYYKYYQYSDKETFSEFSPCEMQEEKQIIENSVEKLLRDFISSNISQNVIYWSVLIYYYIIMIIEYNAVSLCNQKYIKRHIHYKIIPELMNKCEYEKLDKIQSIIILDSEIPQISEMLLYLSFSDDPSASFIRKNINFPVV